MAIRFTERELDIMAVLWERGSATPAEVRETLATDGLHLAYNTVQTLLRILKEKGYVTHTDEGRAHRFHPTVARAVAGRTVLDRVVDKLFGGSAGTLAMELVSGRGLDTAELQELRKLLDRRLRETRDTPLRSGGTPNAREEKR